MKINQNVVRYLTGFILGSFSIIAYNNKPSMYIFSVIVLLLMYIYKDLQSTKNIEKKDDDYI